MGTSLTRQNKRLSEQLEAAKSQVKEQADQLGVQKLRLEHLEGTIRLIEDRERSTVNTERALRIAAQRSLIREIRVHCPRSDHQVAYDPDQDPQIIEGIKAGLFPPKGEAWLLKEIANEVIAGAMG